MGITSFLLKCKRVWHALKKPSKKEFWTIAKIAGMGVLILGIFGFLVSLIVKFIIR